MNPNNNENENISTMSNDMSTESTSTSSVISNGTITDSTMSQSSSSPEEQHQIAQTGQSHDTLYLSCQDSSTSSNTTSTSTNTTVNQEVSSCSSSQKRPPSTERPRKALPRPHHHQHVSPNVFTFDTEIHEESLGKKGAEFLVDHGTAANTASTTSGEDSTTTESSNNNSNNNSTTNHHELTPPAKTNQRRWSHKRSASEAYSFTPPSASSIISTNPSTPQLLPYSSGSSTTTGGSQEKSGESSRKKFTLFGFTFGSSSSSNNSKSGSSLHSLALNVSNASTPTFATSPVTTSTSTAGSETLQITSSVTTSSTSENATTTSSGSCSESNEVQTKKVVLDEETMKKRQGVHMASPLNNFISDEQPTQQNSNEIDLIGFLKTASLDDSSIGRPSSTSETDKTDASTNRETTTYGFKTFLDKMRGKSIFAGKISSPVPIGDQESSSENSNPSSAIPLTSGNDDTSSVSQKAPKKLSEKEMRRLKLLERENNQREMMDNILEKINRNGESFAHLSFFDENDQGMFKE